MLCYNLPMGYFSPRPYHNNKRRVEARASTRRRGGAELSARQKKIVRKIVQSQKERNIMVNEFGWGQDMTTASDYIFQLTNIAQGDGEGERLGDVIRPSSLQMNFATMTGASATQGQRYTMRVTILRWHPDTAIETPTNAKVFENTSALQPFGCFITSDSARKKFDVLYDKKVVLHADRNGANGSLVRCDFSKKLSGLVRYNEAATTGSGNLYLIVSASGASANVTEIGGYINVNYFE